MIKNLLTILRLIVFLLWMIIQMPFLMLFHYIKIFMPSYVKMYFYVVCKILGIKAVIKKGQLEDSKKLLLLSNHMSYIDILALGSVLKVNFISKADVRQWPLFGIIAKFGNTVFITRDRMSAKNQINVIDEAFKKRTVPLVIFPEGTSSDGNRVLNFKSSMFSMFENQSKEGILLQPISMAYISHKGKKLTDEERSVFAFYLDEQTLLNHLFPAIKAMPVRIEIIIHQPIDISKFKDRKELALHCQNIVDNGFKELIK